MIILSLLMCPECVFGCVTLFILISVMLCSSNLNFEMVNFEL